MNNARFFFSSLFRSASLLGFVCLAGCGNIPLGFLQSDPTTAEVTGPSSVKAEAAARYIFVSNSQSQSLISYKVDWGDGTIVAAANVKPGTPVGGNHAWAKNGSYTITVTARNDRGESRTTYGVTVSDVTTGQAELNQTLANPHFLPPASINHSMNMGVAPH